MGHHKQFLFSSARAYAFNEYLAALFSPPEVREDLLVLAAYMGELNKIALQVRDPILAEIRFQWWRDALQKGENTGYPIADCVLELKERKGVPVDLLLLLLESRSQELDPHVLTCEKNLETYLQRLERPHLELRALLLGYSLKGDLDLLLKESAEVLGTLRMCRRLPVLIPRLEALRERSLEDVSFATKGQPLYSLDVFQRRIREFVEKIALAYPCLSAKLRALEGDVHMIFLPLALVRASLKVLRASDINSWPAYKDPTPLIRYLSFFFCANLKVF